MVLKHSCIHMHLESLCIHLIQIASVLILNILGVDFLSCSLDDSSIFNYEVIQLDICLAVLLIELKIETGANEKLGK